MAKALIILALLVLVSTAITIAHAFVLRPSTVLAVGTAKKGQYLWKPTRAISLTPTIAAVRVSLSKDDCNDRAGECQYGIAYTTDGGETFTIDDSPAATNFCGLGGMKTVSEDGESATVTCIDKLVKTDDSETKGLIYSTKTFTFTTGSSTVKIADGTETVLFGQPAATLEIPAATALYPGDSIAAFEGPTSKGIFGRNVELTLNNGTVIHSFYKTMDGGATWEYVSTLPFPMGSESALHVTGATKVMVIAGEPNDFKQAVSVFLGSRWEKIENVTYSSPLSTYTSTLGTTVYGGLRGKPGLIGMAAGKKRGSEKLVDFANLHNKVVTRLVNEGNLENFKGLPVGNFSADFLNATEFDCAAGGSNLDINGCATSSYTAIAPMGNGSTVLAFYDKLTNGYNPASGAEGEQTLFVMKLALNETKEMKELEEKLKEEQLAEEKRKQAEERRKQAQREAEERERQKRRAKLRADKAKKAKFVKLDKKNIIAAKKYHEIDNDIIIVRDVDTDFIEQERDTFFDAFTGPNASVIEEEDKDVNAAGAEEENAKKEGASEESAEKEGSTTEEKQEL